MGNKDIKVLDLFAGAGGLTAGFAAASPCFRTVRAVEMDPAAAASYEATFGRDIVFSGDIEHWLDTEEVPRVDVIVGGPPCQGFSTLGKQDEEDERNELWFQYALTIVRAQPKYFVVENVAAFEKSKQYQSFLEAVQPGGILEQYDFQVAILNSADFGAPQKRKRAVIIGHLKALPFPGFPAATHSADSYVTVREALADVPLEPNGRKLPGDRFEEFHGKTFPGPFVAADLHLDRDYAEISLRRFAAIPAGGNRFDLPTELKAPCWVKHQSGSGDVMGRLHWDRPSVTIRTEFFKPEKGRYLHPDQMRAITHLEAAKLQGFPADHKFVGSKTSIAKQIGNAVPIALGAAVARQILNAIKT